MYVWFTPHVTCRLNIFFITWTMILVIVMTIISLHAKVSISSYTFLLALLFNLFRELYMLKLVQDCMFVVP